jgi:hypothetical protein
MSASNAWGVIHSLHPYFIAASLPFFGLLSYIFGRLDQTNSDLRKEIEWLEGAKSKIEAIARAKYLFHFANKED